MTKGKVRYSVELSPAEVAALTKLAGSLGCTSTTGPHPGKPAWRVMLRDIAQGRLVVLPAGKLEDEEDNHA